MTLSLQGDLDVVALRRSLTELVRRHQSLRTHFASRDGTPLQIIVAAGEFELHMRDVSCLPETERRDQVKRLIDDESQGRFDLSRGPLFRASLTRVSELDHVLLMTMHPIICDVWSVGVLRGELSALYGAFKQGLPSPLAEPSLQYVDYAQWQRSWLHGELLERQLGYWKEQLQGAPTALELPTDHRRPRSASHKGSVVQFNVPAQLAHTLSQLACEQSATLFMVLLGAYQLLLSRWSRQTDVVVGSPIAGRTQEQTESMVGLFSNILVFRTVVTEVSFRTLLQQVKNTAQNAYAHQDIPFERLVSELQPARDLSRHPVFQASFVLQNPLAEEFELSGLGAKWLQGHQQSAKVDLGLVMQESAEGLHGRLEYATDLFDQSTMQRFAEHYQRLLGEIVADVLLESLPLTPNGKLDRKALPAPQSEAYERGEYEAPQGQIEQALAEIWKRLLAVERIGRHDNFFQLGGYSLLAIELMGCIAERFGTQVPVHEAFRRPTVERMAQCVGTLLLQSERFTGLERSEYEQGVI